MSGSTQDRKPLPFYRELEELIERYARDHNLLIREVRVRWELDQRVGSRTTGIVVGLRVEATTGDAP